MRKKTALLLSRNECKYSEAFKSNLLDFGFELTTHQSSNARGEAIPEDILSWKGEYIFSFRSLFILPSSLIERASIASINFHPGPPDYPGGGCTNFALLDNAKTYGVTAHLMNEKIDNGKILSVEYFPVFPSDDISSLTRRTHQKLFSFATGIAEAIALNGNSAIESLALSTDTKWREWHGTIKQIDKISILSIQLNRGEMLKVIRAVHTKQFPAKVVINDLEFNFNRDLLE